MEIGYVNGKYVALNEMVIPIDERGHQFGDGVYEVIRIYNGKPFMLKDHIERLLNSANAIRLPVKQTAKDFELLIKEAVKRANLLECHVYLQITRGITPRQHLFPDVPVSITMTVREAKSLPLQLRSDGVKVILHEDERWANCYIKSLNLLPNILAKQAAHEAGCYEAILVRNGLITEGTSSNVFMVKDSRIFTTPLSKAILPGITRMAVKRVCQTLTIDFVEQHITPEELLQADEVFMTSTTAEILPIVQVDNQEIGWGKPGNLTRKLYDQLQQVIAE